MIILQSLNFIGNTSVFFGENNNSAYLKKDDYVLLLDCGENIFNEIKNMNILNNVKKIDIWISHLHGDHAGSLSTFIFYCFYVLNITPNILMKKGYDDLYMYLKITGCISQCNVTEIDNIFEIHENLHINILPISHSDNIKSYCLLIYDNEKTIFFSGDAKKIPVNIYNLFVDGKINEFYIDCCNKNYENNPHMNIDEFYQLINGKYNDRIYCMHIDDINVIKKIDQYGFNLARINNE